jgi:hypothetical protein
MMKPARVKDNKKKKRQKVYAIDSAPLDGTLTGCKTARVGN